MADFPSSPLPEYPIEELFAEPDVLISQHRDGSEQRRYKGAGKLEEFILRFGQSLPLTNTERMAIVNHYIAQHGRATSFNWAHPERGTVYLVRYNDRPNFQLVGYNCYSGSISLKVVNE